MAIDNVIHVVDDDEAMRESLIALLAAFNYEARGYACAEELLSVAAPEPGCVVSDVRMPGADGLVLLQRLQQMGAGLPLVLISGHGDIPLAVAAMKAGAVDFLEKPFEASALLKAVSSALGDRLGRPSPSAEREAARKSLDALTVREREVLERLVAGDSNKEAAQRLGISHRTVEFHRAHIMERTGAASFSELVRLCLLAAG